MATNGHDHNHLGVNLSYTKFLFVTARVDDNTTYARVKAAGAMLARGFFNDFDSDGRREPQPLETIQFLVADPQRVQPDGLLAARYVATVSAKYRPRLQDVEDELKRRVGEHASVAAIDGAVQVPRYTSAEMHAFAAKHAVPRTSGRAMRNAIIIPIRKTADWWALDPLERQGYFYPRTSRSTGREIPGHAKAAEAGIPAIFRRLYHNPDGYQHGGEYDFITYFECTDEHLATFDTVCAALRDERKNPEWRYVEEGPEWRGVRVLRW